MAESSDFNGPATVTSGPDETEDLSCVSINTHRNNLAYLINEVYRNVIEKDVDFGAILCYMPFMTEIMPLIYNLKRKDKKEAAKVFFDHLKNVDQEGKYQSFVDALRSAKYPIIVKALENKEPIQANEDEHRQLIMIFFKDITETIDHDILTNELQMRDVITSEDGEQIRRIAKYSILDANLELIMAIPLRNVNWYEIFLEVLFKLGHKHLVDKIDSKFFAKKKESSEEEPMSITDNTYMSLPAVNSLTSLSRQNKNINLPIVNDSTRDSEVKQVRVSENSNSLNLESGKKVELDMRVNGMAVNLKQISQTGQREISSKTVNSNSHSQNSQREITSSDIHSNPHSLSEQREPTTPLSSDFKTEIINELTGLKSLIQKQTNSLKYLLLQCEHIVKNVESLEQKLNQI